jgi:AraC-like DNA-binding protein
MAGSIRDPDAVARLAESDPRAASELILDGLEPHRGPLCDWPDLLAAALRHEPNVSIRDWADEMSLAASTVSRRFRALYGCTAAAYRTEVRGREALRRIVSTSAPLSSVAMEGGFSDQAHMTRTIRRLTGAPPRSWRDEPYLSKLGATGVEPSSRIGQELTP